MGWFRVFEGRGKRERLSRTIDFGNTRRYESTNHTRYPMARHGLALNTTLITPFPHELQFSRLWNHEQTSMMKLHTKANFFFT